MITQRIKFLLFIGMAVMSIHPSVVEAKIGDSAFRLVDNPFIQQYNFRRTTDEKRLDGEEVLLYTARGSMLEIIIDANRTIRQQSLTTIYKFADNTIPPMIVSYIDDARGFADGKTEPVAELLEKVQNHQRARMRISELHRLEAELETGAEYAANSGLLTLTVYPAEGVKLGVHKKASSSPLIRTGVRTIYLQNGRTLTGEILEESATHYTVNAFDGTIQMSFDKSEVLRIE